jgi:hypothetical protein
MRKTSYYGRTVGAVAIELRRGSVNRIELGPVKWYGASANLIGGPLTFGPVATTIEGKCAKALAARLSAARLAYHRGEIGPAEYADRVEMECGR